MLRTRNRRRFLFDPLESRMAMTGFFVSPSGDNAAAGTIDAPWKTVPHAVASVAPGDVINLRAGSYAGGIYISKPDLTIQSHAGERATLTAAAGDNNLYFAAPGGKALNLDLDGGFYGVKFDEDRGLVDGCKITRTSYYGIKVVPGADHVTISSTEIANTASGGIDDVNGDYLTVRDSYIHDTGSDGLHIKGGAIGVVIERNRVENSKGAGISVGQWTDTVFFDSSQNPDSYEIIRPIVRNNIVTGTDYAGIAIYAAQQPEVYNNTLIDTARVGQGSIYLATTRSTFTTDPSIVNNIVTRSVDTGRPLVFITNNGFTGTLTMDHNRYYNGGANTSFWDERSGSAFYGTFAGWPAHIGVESGSTQGDPGLDGTGHLVAGSACIDAGRALASVADDIDRVARVGTYDIGADEFTPPRPSITLGDVTVTEGHTGTRVASFTLTLSAASGQPVTVAYATANGTAAAGDYQAMSGTLTFAPGETSKTLTVMVNGDRTAEPDETFVVDLGSPTNATIADGRGVATIRDDEPRISISDVTRAEGRKGKTTLFNFTVTLSAAYDQAVTMSFHTADGTATTSDWDYLAVTGTLTFAPGETTKTITIQVKGDSRREADETFYLDLFGNSGNSLFSKYRGLGTILNDD